MGCGQSTSNKAKHVVVIGGGYGGSYLTRILQQENSCQVTLVDPKEAFLHRFGIPRCLVEPEFLDEVLIPYSSFIRNHVREKVISINRKKKQVILDSKKKISYDYLVVCTGKSFQFPVKLDGINGHGSLEEAKALYKKINSEMKRSPEIVILGGNIFAVELAGEIRSDYPDKKVTIVHSSSSNLVLDNLPSVLQEALKDTLERKEVDVILNEEVLNVSELVSNKYEKEQVVKTMGGKDVVADLVLTCDRVSSSLEFCKGDFSETSFTNDGRILCNDFMKVHGCENIYAIGDVVSKEGEISHLPAKEQAKVVATNIQADINPGVQKITYKIGDFAAIISAGRYGGVGYKNERLEDDEFAIIEGKSEHVYAEEIRTDFGLNE